MRLNFQWNVAAGFIFFRICLDDRKSVCNDNEFNHFHRFCLSPNYPVSRAETWWRVVLMHRTALCSKVRFYCLYNNTNPTPHPHLAATLLLLSAPSRDKISVVVKILPAANIRRRDETQGDSVFSTGAWRVSGRELVGVTSNKWKLSRTGFSSPSPGFPTTIVPWKCGAAEQAAKSASALHALSGFVGTCRARHLADCLVLNNILSKETVPFNKPPNQYKRSWNRI